MAFDILDVLFLPTLFLTGVISSYQDFKYGKIENKWIIFGLAWGMGIYFLIAILNSIGYNGIFSSILANPLFNHNWTNLIGDVLLNSFCSFFLGFLLWRFGLWSAGDAKLFLVFSFLLPLKYYFNGYFSVFPSIVLFINVFLCAFLFLLGTSVFYIVKSLSFVKIKKIFGKNQISLKRILKNVANLNFLKIFLRSLLVLIFVFAIAGIIAKEFQSHHYFNVNIFTIIVIIGLIIFNKSIMKFTIRFYKIMAICLAIYFVYISILLPEYLIPLIRFILRIVTMFSIFFIILIVLPEFYIKQAQKINMPFAIWLVLGTIITMIFKSSVLSFLNF